MYKDIFVQESFNNWILNNFQEKFRFINLYWNLSNCLTIASKIPIMQIHNIISNFIGTAPLGAPRLRARILHNEQSLCLNYLWIEYCDFARFSQQKFVLWWIWHVLEFILFPTNNLRMILVVERAAWKAEMTATVSSSIMSRAYVWMRRTE